MPNCNDENFIGPILKITLLENIFVSTDSDFISDLEFPMCFRFRRLHFFCNLLRIFQSHIIRCHTDSPMKRSVVRVYERRQNIDPSFRVSTGHVTKQSRLYRTIESLDTGCFNVIVQRPVVFDVELFENALLF